MGMGYLTIQVSLANEAVPVEGATVTIQDLSGRILYMLTTDASGRTKTVGLYAPDKAYTEDLYYGGMPYATYRVTVTHPGLTSVLINGVQIFDTVEAVEYVEMHPAAAGGPPYDVINIPPHTLVQRTPTDQQGAVPPLAGRPQ